MNHKNVFGVSWLFSLIGLYVSLFSIFCSIASVSVKNGFWFLFWVDLSLIGLYPVFFMGTNKNRLSVIGFVSMVVANSISSGFIGLGLINPENYSLLISISYIIKFGGFPFSLWLFNTFNSCSWIIIFYMVGFFKLPFIAISFILKESYMIYCSSGLTILICGGLLIFSTWNWLSCFSLMMTSSSAVLLSVVCCVNNSLIVPIIVWGFSSIWFIKCIIYCYYYMDSNGELVFSDKKSVFLFFQIFTVAPLADGFFYKIVVSYFLIQINWFVLLCWVVYSMVEQIYIWNYIWIKTNGFISIAYKSNNFN